MSIRKNIRTEKAVAGFYRVYESSRLLGTVYGHDGDWRANITELDGRVIKANTMKEAVEHFVEYYETQEFIEAERKASNYYMEGN